MIPLGPVRASAKALTIVIPIVMVVVGAILAVASAIAAQEDATESIGAFGLEFGAALWFGGALTLGARPRPTVRRLVLFASVTLGALGLILAALIGSWSGAALDLSMEFGVGLLAVVVIDLVLLRFAHGYLDVIAAVEGDAVRIGVAGATRGASITSSSDESDLSDESDPSEQPA